MPEDGLEVRAQGERRALAGVGIDDGHLTIGPRDTFTRTFALAGRSPCTVRLADGSGRVVIEHTEGRYDVTPADQVRTGPQPTWIRFEFNGVYKLHEMWVWNHNVTFSDLLCF